MNKKYFFSHRVLAMLLTLALCLGMIPTVSAAQQNSYHDPVEHWQQASNRTNELDVNAIVTHETFYCATCRENTDFTVWRVPEYTRSGETALNRNVKYSNGMCIDEVTVGSLDAGIRHDSLTVNDFAGFFRRHPQIRYVFFNGEKATSCFHRYVAKTDYPDDLICQRLTGGDL